MKIMMISLLCLIIIFCSFSEITGVSVQKSKKKKVPKGKVFFQGYFYILELFPGTDAIANLLYSSKTPKLKYFTLNSKLLFYSNSKKDSRQIEKALKIIKIVNKREDDIPNGKCCSNIRYTKFTPKILNSPTKAPLFTKTKIKKPKLSLKNANYCLDIFAPNIARWRLCSVAPMDVYRLQLKLIFSVIKSKSNFKDPKHVKRVIDKFLSNSRFVRDPVPYDWNWETQRKWPGRCQSRFMQSPQKIESSRTIIYGQPNFSFSHSLLNTHVEIVRRYSELVIKFKNDPGLLSLTYGDKKIVYVPKYISFRFPGEHNILGKRYDGDMIIHCDEYTLDSKTKRTNGLWMTFPLETHSLYSNFEIYENLSVDFWRHMVAKKGKYIPSNFLSKIENHLAKKKYIFGLKDLITNVMEMNPLLYLYLGSQTTPPCEEYVNHIVVGKPIKISTCQMKVLRQNTMATFKERQIHSRLSQFNEDFNENNDELKIDKGKIYVINKASYDPDLRIMKKKKPLVPIEEDELNC